MKTTTTILSLHFDHRQGREGWMRLYFPTNYLNKKVSSHSDSDSISAECELIREAGGVFLDLGQVGKSALFTAFNYSEVARYFLC